MSSAIVSCVQRAAAAALGEKSADRDLAGDHQVVVAGERQVAALAGKGHAVVGLRAVAHQVAQAPDLLGALGVHVVEHRLEGGPVPVDV